MGASRMFSMWKRVFQSSETSFFWLKFFFYLVGSLIRFPGESERAAALIDSESDGNWKNKNRPTNGSVPLSSEWKSNDLLFGFVYQIFRVFFLCFISLLSPLLFVAFVFERGPGATTRAALVGFISEAFDWCAGSSTHGRFYGVSRRVVRRLFSFRLPVVVFFTTLPRPAALAFETSRSAVFMEGHRFILGFYRVYSTVPSACRWLSWIPAGYPSWIEFCQRRNTSAWTPPSTPGQSKLDSKQKKTKHCRRVFDRWNIQSEVAAAASESARPERFSFFFLLLLLWRFLLLLLLRLGRRGVWPSAALELPRAGAGAPAASPRRSVGRPRRAPCPGPRPPFLFWFPFVFVLVCLCVCLCVSFWFCCCCCSSSRRR